MLLQLLLLLLKDLALLHLFHHLLGSTHRAIGTEAWPAAALRLGSLNGSRLLRLFRLVRDVFVGVLLGTVRAGSACRAAFTRAQHDLARGALADVSSQQHVIPGALQELRKYIPRLSRTIFAVYTLICTETFHLRSRLSRDLGEDLLEAGV